MFSQEHAQTIEQAGLKEVYELVALALDTGAPVNGIDNIRHFDTKHPGARGYYWQLPGFTKNPFSIVVITDPELAFQTLKQQEAITTDTVFHNSHQHIRGRFVVTEHNPRQWVADKRHVGKGFFANQEALTNMPYHEVSQASLLSVIGTESSTNSEITLSPNWLKYLSATQVTHHLAGTQIPQTVLYPAVEALLDISNHPISLLTLGSLTHSPLKKKLKPYYTLVEYIVANRTEHSILEKVLVHILEHRRTTVPDTADHYSSQPELATDVTRTLIAGLSALTAAYQGIFLYLSEHPELQTKIQQELATNQESRLLTQTILDALKRYPPLPLLARKIEKPLTIGGKDFSSGYVLIPQATFGGEKYEDVYGTNPHYDGIFGTGPRRCIAQHYAPHILESTVATLLKMGLTISCDNNPKPVIKGVALRFSEPLEFKLTDEKHNYTVIATSAG